jgi:LemA protein
MVVSMARIRGFFAVILLGLTVAGCGYNTIPTLEVQAKAKWSDVQNNYQRRADPRIRQAGKGGVDFGH